MLYWDVVSLVRRDDALVPGTIRSTMEKTQVDVPHRLSLG